MLALSRDLGVQYKTAFVLAHKIREAMASEIKGMQVGGEGKTVETDGGYFGGYVNRRTTKRTAATGAWRRTRTASAGWSWSSGNAMAGPCPPVFRTEAAAYGLDRGSRVRKDFAIMADEAGSWADLHARYEVSRIDHGQLYSTGAGVYTNNAESFSAACGARKSATITTSLAQYLVRYAQENSLEGGLPPSRQRAAGPADHRAGHGVPPPSVDFLRILAAGEGGLRRPTATAYLRSSASETSCRVSNGPPCQFASHT